MRKCPICENRAVDNNAEVDKLCPTCEAKSVKVNIEVQNKEENL